MMKRIPWFKRWVIRQVEFSNVVPSRLCYCRKSQPFVAISLLFLLQIPVFLSQALTKNLYIYQYPVRPATRDWNDTNILNASVKPRNQMVRLEVGLDTYSEKYCSSKGEQIALNTDGHQVMLQSLLKPSHMLFCVKYTFLFYWCSSFYLLLVSQFLNSCRPPQHFIRLWECLQGFIVLLTIENKIGYTSLWG